MTGLMVEIAGIWLLAVLAGLPLFASMGLAAFAFVHIAGLADSIVPQKMIQAMNSFPIIAAPLFIMMGNILGAARITDRIVAFAGALIGSVRGGYAAPATGRRRRRRSTPRRRRSGRSSRPACRW